MGFKYCSADLTGRSAERSNTTEYRNNNINHQGRIVEHKMPTPIFILSYMGVRPGKVTSAGYITIKCPLDRCRGSRDSKMYIHNVLGNFRCSGCGERGRDVLALFCRAKKIERVMAAKLFGAWEYFKGDENV